MRTEKTVGEDTCCEKKITEGAVVVAPCWQSYRFSRFGGRYSLVNNQIKRKQTIS